MNEILSSYGYGDRFSSFAEQYPDLYPARILTQHHLRYEMIGQSGTVSGTVSGKFSYEAADYADYPAVGDWVMIDRTDNSKGDAVIHAVLPRKSCFARSAAGKESRTQIIAANIDLVFLCMSMNENFNLRRTERYLAAIYDSGAMPVIVLTKSDLAEHPEEYQTRIASVAGAAEVFAINESDAEGLERIKTRIRPGMTVAFVGSSGVGKSTLINRLLGASVQQTKDIRGDGKGRHTTTTRDMILMSHGGVLIDTPGMREFQLDSANVADAFGDIGSLALSCRFRDCTHTTEPGCAVIDAVEKGNMEINRLESYRKLSAEVDYEGLSARGREQAKIEKMFGSKKEMKRRMDESKNKKKYRY
ncbi:MAG: ribosome small subunit-dependent GTPase A [Anaerofustis sp.]